MGLSPRVRGKHPHPPAADGIRGSIPACTGETLRRTPWSPTAWVYPRVYGGNGQTVQPAYQHHGLSPRVRGKLHGYNFDRYRIRSIPACTGETSLSACRPAPTGVYPRVYGGNLQPGDRIRGEIGLSPRVRGKPAQLSGWCGGAGSIPACTGETMPLWKTAHTVAVYPRVYGGNPRIVGVGTPGKGLSPRVRGKRRVRIPCGNRGRSIPACTGETTRLTGNLTNNGVYPRVYGGNLPQNPNRMAIQGLSPRVRGKLRPPPGVTAGRRSIPACTGETLRGVPVLETPGVYPRVYGGNTKWNSLPASAHGLSPRVRGKRLRRHEPHTLLWSIPACTGETPAAEACAGCQMVYPRVYGGNPSALRCAI